jgi:hypothetical protein
MLGTFMTSWSRHSPTVLPFTSPSRWPVEYSVIACETLTLTLISCSFLEAISLVIKVVNIQKRGEHQGASGLFLVSSIILQQANVSQLQALYLLFGCVILLDVSL